jgi:UDP-glucose 4-epimerase
VATANVKALLSKATDQTFNVGCQRETTLLQLLNALLSVNNSNLKPEFLKENSVNPVSRRLANITKSKEFLDFKPKYSLNEGLKILSDWYFKKP